MFVPKNNENNENNKSYTYMIVMQSTNGSALKNIKDKIIENFKAYCFFANGSAIIVSEKYDTPDKVYSFLESGLTNFDINLYVFDITTGLPPSYNTGHSGVHNWIQKYMVNKK